MRLSDDQFLERVRAFGPFRHETEARLAIVTTLEVLGRGLFEDEGRRIAEDLPALAAHALTSNNRGEALGPARFFTELSSHWSSRPSQCIEHAEVVCHVLAEALPPATLTRLHEALPELAELCAAGTESETPPPLHERHATARTLSEARPGSERPLSSAVPTDLAHRHSIARSDDPHADTKLSSASGLTQEREDRTLSRGRPGSERPLSRGR